MPERPAVNLGTPAQFEALRQLLISAGYSEENVSRRLGVASFSDFGMVEPHRKLTTFLETPFDVLVRLFLECDAVPGRDAERLLGGDALPLLADLGLLLPAGGVRRMHFAGSTLSDAIPAPGVGSRCPGGERWPRRAGGRCSLPRHAREHAAFSQPSARVSLRRPARLGHRYRCCGVRWSRQTYARRAWACDIAERAVRFAEFNRRLNGLDNVTVCKGDLYEPVRGRAFDRIVTHPPYVPSASSGCVFRDGGDDGEQIIRRIVKGLPEYLKPGGRFYCLALLSDREGEGVEARVRTWLGESGSEFDVAVVAETARTPADFIGRSMQRGAHSLADLKYWSTIYRERKVEFLVYGCILIQRRKESRRTFTVRVQKGRASGPAETEWLLGWQTRASGANALQAMLDAKPRKSAHLHLAVLHRMNEGQLTPDEFMFRVSHPFESESRCQGWVVATVERCDGSTPVRSIFEELKNVGAIESESGEREFIEVVQALVGAGYLEVDEYPIPAPAGP